MGPMGRVSKAGIKGEYSHLKFGSFWRWFKWRWNYLKTVFSTGNWSVNNSQADDFQRESRYLSRRAPMSFITHLKGETGIRFNCFIVSSRAQPECGAAVSPLLLWGIPHNRRSHRRGKQTPTFSCLSINMGTKYTEESLKGFPIGRSYI